jgi:hypothetical protein
MYMMHNSRQYYQDLIRIATDFEAGVVDLMQGRIPARILSPSRMKELLINAEMEVYKGIPEYTLMFSEVRHYYNKVDVVYKLVHNQLVVIIALHLRKRNQHPMELYEIQTCHVPYEISNEESSTYTKVKMVPSHLAVIVELYCFLVCLVNTVSTENPY